MIELLPTAIGIMLIMVGLCGMIVSADKIHRENRYRRPRIHRENSRPIGLHRRAS